MSHRLTVANFLLALEKENDWRTLGIFLDIEDFKLDEIERLYEPKGIRRCKEELFKVLKHKKTEPTWEEIAESLDNMRNHALANEIREKYNSDHVFTTHRVTSNDDSPSNNMEITHSTSSVNDITSKMYLIDLNTVRKLESLHAKFALLVDNVRRQLNVKCV